MALRSIHVMKSIIEDMEAICPRARLFNYTNPVNIVSEAVTHHTYIPTISLCEGPINGNREFVEMIGLDPDKLDAVSIGLNHGSWTVRHLYDGQDFISLLRDAYERRSHDPEIGRDDLKSITPRLDYASLLANARSEWRLLELACWMDSLPSHYFQYYYFKDEILAELQAKPTTRAQDIMASVPDYWAHYREQAAREIPELDPDRSRGGINELELAIDLMDAIYNDRKEVWYVNVPNQGAIADFPDDLVVEVVGYADRNGVVPLVQGYMPRHVLGLVQMLGEYQALTAEAAWSGKRTDAVRALASHPLVFSLHKAQAIYDEMAAAHRQYLPERLLR
jgi:6-phospho-beta-glucosidase